MAHSYFSSLLIQGLVGPCLEKANTEQVETQEAIPVH